MDFKWYETAENFIRYATIHKLQRANHKIDPITTIDEYVYKRDWRIKANANQGYSVGGMILNTSGKLLPITGSIMFTLRMPGMLTEMGIYTFTIAIA